MYSIPARGVHVTHFVHLDAVWNGCVDEGEESSVGEGVRLGVDVEGVADDGIQLHKRTQNGPSALTSLTVQSGQSRESRLRGRCQF